MVPANEATPWHWKRLLAAFLAVLAAGLTVIGSTGAAKAVGTTTIKPTCSKSLQSMVNAAPSGGVVTAPGGCIYRQSVTINKPLTLKAGLGAEIRGSNVWTGWTKGSQYWVKGTLPAFSRDGQCKPGTSRCKWPEQVFFDGRPLLQVASNPKLGQFAVNSSRKVVLANNPAGHTVEVTMRDRWIVGGSNNVTVEGFVMKHAANGRSGAIQNNGHDNWTVRNNNLSYAHATNVSLTEGTGLKLIGNDIHLAGQMGASCNDAVGILVQNNRIHDNNTEDFDPGWASGGMKIAGVRGFRAEGNDVYRNDQHGFWTDVAARNVTFVNNRIHHNVQSGLHMEITDGIDIHNNVIYENGWGDRGDGLTQAGIFLRASRDANIYGNTVAWNNDGITILNSNRNNGVGGSDPIYDTVSDVHVYNNNILSKDYGDGRSHTALAWAKTFSGGNIDSPRANNGGHDNRYYYGQREGSQKRYKWVNTTTQSLSAFNNTPGEERGRYMSSTEKTRVVTAAAIPGQPAH